MTNTQHQLAEAIARRSEARCAFASTVVGSSAWRQAEEDLNFWQGKVAALDAVASRPVRMSRPTSTGMLREDEQ